ncbi:MAG: hypothetical protein HZB56_06810 [Deltaproteobacteria bacterium]|nr:hypothetical protein [Deltaproteobacteria bacterium]
MAPGRLRRFLRLESPAPAGNPGPPVRSENRAWRFWSIRRPRSPWRRSATGASPERFGPEHVPPAEVIGNDGSLPAVVRCRRCGRESGVLEPRCRGCDADLDSAEQQAFNEAWWRERQADADRRSAMERERRVLQARSWREAAQGGASSAAPRRRAGPGRWVAVAAAAAALLWLLVRGRGGR